VVERPSLLLSREPVWKVGLSMGMIKGFKHRQLP